ncbi:hypothetical protein CFP56_008282 [Quercus suber]|uniref:Uncharacterized protein n=1 Tax=Quercus suber TaxID=58331 RepID=A0AAW0L5V7_QUESU
MTEMLLKEFTIGNDKGPGTKVIPKNNLYTAQDLLQQCLSFSTQNVEDCPHFFTALNTGFCREA